MTPYWVKTPSFENTEVRTLQVLKCWPQKGQNLITLHIVPGPEPEYKLRMMRGQAEKTARVLLLQTLLNH